jgi:hypothetical protein
LPISVNGFRNRDLQKLLYTIKPESQAESLPAFLSHQPKAPLALPIYPREVKFRVTLPFIE